MKHKILIMFMVLSVMLLFIGGCVEIAETEPTGEPPVTEAGENITTEEEPQREEVEGGEGEEVEEKIMSEELSELLAKAEQKVTSMYYLFYGPPQDHIGYGFYVRGEKMKVSLPARVRFDEGRHYDTVYLNTDTKLAYGYCEAPECADKETAFTVKYKDYIKETPFDKLKLVEYGEIKGDETVENRKTKVVEFEGKNVSGKMWIDTYSGLPLKVEEVVEGETIKTEYRSLSVNSVMEEDVTH